MRHTTSSPDQTILLGKDFASTLNGGDIVLLHGDLGAGKTTFVKGIAEGLGVTDDIVSPTFTLLNIYQTNNNIRKSGLSVIRKLVHIDTYRLETEDQLIEIGIEDYLGEINTVCVIEWPEKLKTLLKDKKNIISVTLEHVNQDERSIAISQISDF